MGQLYFSPDKQPQPAAEASDMERMKKQLSEAWEILNNERKKFEEEKSDFLREVQREKRELENRENLFEAQWEFLKRELTKLSYERDEFEKLKRQKPNFGQVPADVHLEQKCSILFSGVGDFRSLRKRYHELLKIFHPDNGDGSTFVIQMINRNYEQLKAIFCRENANIM